MTEQITSGTKKCPYCMEEVQADAVRCKHCRSWLGDNPLHREWRRARNGTIAGVCAGLGKEFGISVTAIRLLFVLATIFGGGIGLVIYIVLMFIMSAPAPDVK